MVAAGACIEDELRPIAPYVGWSTEGTPAFLGAQCSSCQEVMLGVASVCPKCGAQGALQPMTLAKTGTLYNFTIVHRSLPGVPVPFVSAIVELDGGGVVKGTLAAPPEKVAFDMRVVAEFKRAEQVDSQGRSYLIYQFVAA